MEKEKFVNYGFIKEENRKAYESLINLKDSNGHYALSSTQRTIVEYIGSMSREKGCFSTEAVINEQTIRCKTRKTLKRHLQYLEEIKAISKTIEGRKRIYRIEFVKGTVKSLKEYRVIKGLSEYSYVKKDDAKQNMDLVKTAAQIINNKEGDVAMKEPNIIDTSWFYEDEVKSEPKNEEQIVVNIDILDDNFEQKNALFLSEKQAKFAQKEGNLSSKQANFATVLYTELELTQKETPSKEKGFLVEEKHEFEDSFWNETKNEDMQNRNLNQLAAQAFGDKTDCPRIDSPPAHQVQPKSFSFKKEKTNSKLGEYEEQSSDSTWDEPLLGKQKKKPRTQGERKLHAEIEKSKGHVVNPLGVVNNRPRKLNPKLARDIEPTGCVTIPQLYKHLIILYNNAFGEGIIQQMLPDDKSAIQVYFSKVKQQFIDSCKYEPENRDVAEYFEWILEPSRAARLLGSAKYGNEKGHVHFNQLSGMAHIRKFYDQVLKEKKKLPDNYETDLTEETRKIRQDVIVLEKMMDEFRSSQSDINSFIMSLVGNGCAIGAQFLYEEKNLNPDECRLRIISDMAEYINRAKNKEECISFLNLMVKTSYEKEALLSKDYIWFDLDKWTKTLVRDAVEKCYGEEEADVKYKSLYQEFKRKEKPKYKIVKNNKTGLRFGI